VFNANLSSISSITWSEHILYIRHLEDPKTMSLYVQIKETLTG